MNELGRPDTSFENHFNPVDRENIEGKSVQVSRIKTHSLTLKRDQPESNSGTGMSSALDIGREQNQFSDEQAFRHMKVDPPVEGLQLGFVTRTWS